MMQHEFEKLAGYEVSYDDYHKIIEPMYMATELSKQEFVKLLDKKRFALKTKEQMIAEVKALSESLRDTCEHYIDESTESRIRNMLPKFQERFGGYWSFERKHPYCRDRGCSYPAVLVHSDMNWNEIDRFDLAKAYWEKEGTAT